MPIALFTGKFLDTVLTLYWVWPWCTGQSVPQTVHKWRFTNLCFWHYGGMGV